VSRLPAGISLGPSRILARTGFSALSIGTMVRRVREFLTSYLDKIEDGPKPKFNVGDKVRVLCDRRDRSRFFSRVERNSHPST